MATMASFFGAKTEEKTPHRTFLETQLIPNVQKLQKEIGWRRHKECQSPLQEAYVALKGFCEEDASPTSPSTSPAKAPPTLSNETATAMSEDDTLGGDTTASIPASTSSDDAPPTAPEEESEGDSEHSSSKESSTQQQPKQQQTPKPMEDDPQTREIVHPAIVSTLEAYMKVLQTIPVKQPRPGEIALEGINLIVANRYFSGRAGLEPDSLLQRLLESIAKCSDSSYETVQAQLVAAISNVMCSPKCSVHEAVMLTALKTVFHVYLVAKSANCKQSSKTASVGMLKAVFFRMEAYHVLHKPPDDDGTKPTFASQYHADAYYLFRSLCKLSSKELPADNVDESAARNKSRLFINTLIPTDPTELNSKILSLELILQSMDFCGEAFYSPKFLYLVQHYLCGSLLKNCVSNHTHVAFLSQKIFLVLVKKFKEHLKTDIEVFMSNVFFRVLESQNSSFKQKGLVLESLSSLCKDPVLLTQIFLNYDCDFDAMNLYKDIVHMLTKLSGRATSMPSSSLSKKDAEQDFELSLAAIECLISILKAFLRALNLPAGDVDDRASSRIRGMLQLDSALIGDPIPEIAESVVSDDNVSNGQSSQDAIMVSAPASQVAERIVDAFDRKRNAEQNFEIGGVKFTLSLKQGLNFFIDNGFVERDAKKIAVFFLNNKDKLDKTQIGECLGREPDAAFVKEDGLDAESGGPGFWVRILHHYAEAIDFTDLLFDEAIRLFLSGFRLPGEAQKIDRIMEKFAERFTSQNPTVFSNSDTAFILAFSVIMLQTDLHNPSIKEERRMTVDSFIRNNRGIGEGGSDLTEDFLRGIFERIKKSPFSLKEDDAARERVGAQKQIFDTTVFFEGSSSLFGTTAEDRKREKFKQERDEMMAATEQLIRRRPGRTAAPSASKESVSMEAIAPADVVKPMFDVTWGPMIGILSQVLECSDDERSVAVCLNGFVFAIRLASHSDMTLARDTFVSSLAKFTFLGSLKEMKRKNVESIRTLLSVAIVDGEFLGECWGQVLQCMSQLARLRLSASGLDADDSFLMVESPKRIASLRQESSTSLFRQTGKEELAREAEENNGKAVLEAVQEVLIDKVFSSTVNLSAKSLAGFVEQLIAVASTEVEGNSAKSITGVAASASTSDSVHGGSGASIFSLQRLVDVADHNMHIRPRLVWAQIWDLMSDFFVNLACHETTMVSVFAIDSLKQLSLKFLDKPELSEFNFQRSFLRPFEVVMGNDKSTENNRELILQCIDNIVRTKSHSLKSGWKIVFSILTLGAKDKSEKIKYLGFNILQTILDEHLDNVGCLAETVEGRNRNTNADDFVHLVKASLSFVQFEDSGSLRPFGLTMRALCHTAIYADLLAARRVLAPTSGAQFSNPEQLGYTYDGLSDEESLGLVLWRPIFEGLADGVRSTAKTSSTGVGCLVQRGSVLALRSILLRHGQVFSTAQLAAILRDTVIPTIQSAAENEESPVVDITSENPSASSIDFLVKSLPLPPEHDDESMSKLAKLNTAPKRPVGPAELMFEASFTDLRHGGDGDLRKAHILATKNSSEEGEVSEQPFPNSWLATTAPIALGLLTDIASEFVVYREDEGRTLLWPLIEQQYKLWCIGFPTDKGASDDDAMMWSPCEALVRTSCMELAQLSQRIFCDSEFADLSRSEQAQWGSKISTAFSDIVRGSVEKEELLVHSLTAVKDQVSLDRENQEDDLGFENLSSRASSIQTPFGIGELLTCKNEGSQSVDVVKLEWGAMLYQPSTSNDAETPIEPLTTTRIPDEVDVPDAYWVQLVPALKKRCVAAYCLQLALAGIMSDLVPLAGKGDITILLENLDRSRIVSSSAVANEDIAMAFQESLLKEWGDGIRVPDEDTEASARLSLLHGSAIFFLAQEASATKAYLRLLSSLYLKSPRSVDGWDRVEFAESILTSSMTVALDKFLVSEEKDGHLIDQNMWRHAIESGGKVALYCTTFASTIVDILNVILEMGPAQFAKQKHVFFPRICALVRVQSNEIREIVQDILSVHVASFVGVKAPRSLRRLSTVSKD